MWTVKNETSVTFVHILFTVRLIRQHDVLSKVACDQVQPPARHAQHVQVSPLLVMCVREVGWLAFFFTRGKRTRKRVFRPLPPDFPRV